MNNRLNTKKIIQKLKIIFFIIIAPVSLSYGNLNNISFEVIDYPKIISINYLFTLPVSLFISIPFIFLSLLNFYKNKEIIFLLFLSLIFLSNSILYNDYDFNLAILLKISFPILLIIGFELYFKNFFQYFKKKKISEDINKINQSFLLIFIVIFFITLISPLYLKTNYSWFVNQIKIFDYFQYFSLIFILMLGMLATNKNYFVLLISYILCFYLSDLTQNRTNFILLILFGIYYVISFFKKEYVINISKLTILFIFLFIFFFPLLIVYFNLELTKLFAGNNGIASRIILVNSFLSNVNFIDFFTPIKMSSTLVSKYYHNELIVIISALGLTGGLFFYYFLFKRLWVICEYYPYIAVSISLFSILSGVTITSNLHPYTFVISSFFISYYHSASKARYYDKLKFFNGKL
jgi:hypothetical protein